MDGRLSSLCSFFPVIYTNGNYNPDIVYTSVYIFDVTFITYKNITFLVSIDISFKEKSIIQFDRSLVQVIHCE